MSGNFTVAVLYEPGSVTRESASGSIFYFRLEAQRPVLVAPVPTSSCAVNVKSCNDKSKLDSLLVKTIGKYF